MKYTIETSNESPNPPQKRPSPYLLGVLGVLSLIFVCAKISAHTSNGPTGRTINGTVKFHGKPVVFGSVVLIDSDGLPKSGPIQPDGTFQIEKVIGSAPKIAVSSFPPPGSNVVVKKTIRDGFDTGKKDDNGKETDIPQFPPEVLKNWFPIPNDYGDPQRSGINVEIQNDVLEIVLK